MQAQPVAVMAVTFWFFGFCCIREVVDTADHNIGFALCQIRLTNLTPSNVQYSYDMVRQ